MNAPLLVSLSGMTTRTLHRCAELAAEMERRNVPLSVLYTARTGAGPVTDWVRARRERGDGVLLHGYDHRVTPTHHAVSLGRKAEFAVLPAHEAGLRLIAANAVLEAAGIEIEGFAPPRRPASRGTPAHRDRPLLRSRTRGCGARPAHRRSPSSPRPGVHRGTPAHRDRPLLRTRTRGRAGGPPRRARPARRGRADLARPCLRQALLDAIDVAIEYRAFGTTYGRITAGVAAKVAAGVIAGVTASPALPSRVPVLPCPPVRAC